MKSLGVCLAASLVSQGYGFFNSGGGMHMRNARILFAVLVVLVLVPGLAYGQGSSTATVAATVTAQKGGAVRNATVDLLDTATNASRSQSTNETGYYTFVSVPPGSYKVV